jgi:hypothetical protein
MRGKHFTYLATIGILFGVSMISNDALAQQPSPDAVPVKTVVSVEARHGKEVPVVDHKEDVRAFEGKNRLQVADWVPLQGSNANLELLILIDESARENIAGQWDDVRRFMNAQPPTTAIAIGYMEYGSARIAQKFTTDREAADKALRIPLGSESIGNSPYLAVSDAIKHWPPSNARHAIFMISNGMDPLQPGLTDSYLDASVEDAQRSGTEIYAIYVSGGGHFGHSLWRINQGQNNLSELTDKSGGESYFQGLGSPISFGPFLEEFAERLNHQYLLTVLIPPGKKPTYKHLKLETEVPNAELVMVDQVFVPGEK